MAVGRSSNLGSRVAPLSSLVLGLPQRSYKDALVTIQSIEEQRGGGGKGAVRAIGTAHNEFSIATAASHTIAVGQDKWVGGNGRELVGLAEDDALSTLQEVQLHLKALQKRVESLVKLELLKMENELSLGLSESNGLGRQVNPTGLGHVSH